MKRQIAVLAVLAAFGSAALFAQEDRRRRAPSFDALQEALELTAEQVAALKENGAELRQAARDVMAETREAREGLRAEMQLDEPNPSIVGQHMVAIQQAGKALKAQRAEAREAALQILTEDQRAKLAEFEDAVKAAPVAAQARMLNLIEGPERSRGDRPGFQGRRFGPRPGRR